MAPARPLPRFTSRTFARSAAVMAVFFAASACAVHRDRAQAQPTHPARMVSAGEHVAERNCAECHALGDIEVSPLAEAPPFGVLRTAYSRRQMEQVIRERMHVVHPRMPKLELDVDEVGEFLDYWQSLKPRPPASTSAKTHGR